MKSKQFSGHQISCLEPKQMSSRIFRIYKSTRDVCAYVSTLVLSERDVLYVFCRVSVYFRPHPQRERYPCVSFCVCLSFCSHPHPQDFTAIQSDTAIFQLSHSELVTLLELICHIFLWISDFSLSYTLVNEAKISNWKQNFNDSTCLNIWSRTKLCYNIKLRSNTNNYLSQKRNFHHFDTI
jgi:hypothetical protein